MISSCGCGALGAGVVLGAASILSIGPNNLMLVREGLVRGRVGFVATLVFASYLVLLVTVFFLTDTILTGLSPYRSVLTWLGLGAVSWFAFLSFKAFVRPFGRRAARDVRGETLQGCLRRVMAIVWLNPLTYIEMLLIPASVCQSYQAPPVRLEFLTGLVVMFAIACYGYAFGSGFFSSLFNQQRSLQIFDLTSGILLTCVALFMGIGVVPQIT